MLSIWGQNVLNNSAKRNFQSGKVPSSTPSDSSVSGVNNTSANLQSTFPCLTAQSQPLADIHAVSARYTHDSIQQKNFAHVCSKQDPSDSEIAVGRKWINRTSLARCHTLPMKSCCKVNKAQPAQSAHCDKLKEDFQALPDKNALCKKPRGQSDTEIIKLIIFRAITNSRTRVLIEQPGQHTSFKYSGLFPHKLQRSGNHK